MKAYWCYYWSLQKIFSSYHVQFIKSHQLQTIVSNTPTAPELPPPLPEAVEPKIIQPAQFTDDDTIIPSIPKLPALAEAPEDAAPMLKRSTRNLTSDQAHLEQAVQMGLVTGVTT